MTFGTLNASRSFLYAFAAVHLDTAGRTHSEAVSCRYAWERFTMYTVYGQHGALALWVLEFMGYSLNCWSMYPLQLPYV